MFLVVEFDKNSGGGVAIIREEWMTPRKNECFWPPYKQTTLYNKCLMKKDQQTPDVRWNLYSVDRILYRTESIIKARQKLKEAESYSEVLRGIDFVKQHRKRKSVRKLILYNSSDDEEESSVKMKYLPKPLRKNPVCSKTPDDIYDDSECSSTNATSLLATDYLLDGQSSEAEECNDNVDVSSCTLNQLNEKSSTIFSQGVNSVTKKSVKDSPTNDAFNHSSPGGIALARILARIESRLDNIQQTQKVILEQLSPSTILSNVDLPDFLTLPCTCPEEVDILEDWLVSSEEHANLLVSKLSLLGGKKVAHVVRNLLQEVFTNAVALLYNWTGKHNKRSLKDLAIIKLIPGIVRKNRHTTNATNAEIREVVLNWFRFTKDRDGGRNIRRKHEDYRSGQHGDKEEESLLQPVQKD